MSKSYYFLGILFLSFFIQSSASSQNKYKVAIDYQFDLAYSFSTNGLAFVRKDNKWGIIDQTGKIIVDYQFDNVWPFGLLNYAPVKKDGKWGFIDQTGKVIINYQFDDAWPFYVKGLAFVKKGDKWGAIDQSGKVIIGYQFDNLSFFSTDGIASVKKNGKSGFINQSGKTIIDYRFDDAHNFSSNGLASVKKDGKWGFIDRSGKTIIDYQFDEATYFSSNGIASAKKDGKWGFIDQTGRTVIDYQFDDAHPFDLNGWAPVKSNGKWGAIDQTGKIIVGYQFDEAVYYFSTNGLVAVQKDGKSGFIDQTGKTIIDYQFDWASNFSANGLASVEKNGKWGFIKLITFTEEIKDYVTSRINEWQKKGEFERTADYQKRVNVETRNKKIEEYTQEAVTQLKSEFQNSISPNEFILNKYDADNESFLINSKTLGDFTIPVPLAEAPSFKQNWSSLKFNGYDFYLSDDKFHIARFTVTNPDNNKQYAYDSKQPTTYAINNITYNFAPIDVNLSPEENTHSNKKIENKQITVGLADVDTNIPTVQDSNSHAYALIVGNENYCSYQTGLNSEVNVDYAVNDATIFKEYCQKVLGIPESNIKFLTNATAGPMVQSISWINKIIQLENGSAEAIVYYAGHGLPDEQTHESYIMPVDVSGSNLQSAMRLGDLYAKLTQYPSKRVTVFLDACFSGGGRNMGLVSARGVKVKPKEDALNGNIVVFTSSSGEQSSLPYKDKQHGMFTYFLLKKLQETKGNVNYSDLYDYLKKEVDLNCVKVNSKEQIPSVLTSIELGNQWMDWKLK